MSKRTILPHPNQGVYSPSVTANGEIIFVSGQLGCLNAPENQTFQQECEAAMANLCSVLEQSNSSLALATMCTIYLTDINSYDEFNVVYQQALANSSAQESPPARACFAIEALPRGGRVEIECEAITKAAANTREAVVPGVANLFSASVVGGKDRIVWVAGQLSLKDGKLSGSTIEEQSDGAIECLSTVLDSAGSSLSALFRSTVFLTDMTQYAPMNAIYGNKLGLTTDQPKMSPPTRAAFAVKALPLNGIIEISGVAASDPSANITLPGHSAAPVYSPAVTTGNKSKLVWVSGQVALDPESGTKDLVGAGDVISETKQSLENLKMVLESSGASMETVLKVNIYCADMSDYGMINEVYTSYFGKDSPPARACVQVKELPLGARVELCCVAVEVDTNSGL
jgi:2-iminobutanoate/2-iminopropanoate deaminase